MRLRAGRRLPAAAVRLLQALALSAALLPAAAAPAAPAAPAAAAAQTSAREVVAETIDAVLAVLREKGLDREERRRRIEEIAYARFDFETMSKLVLARNWRRFDAAQREAFVEEFKRLLSRSYGKRIERYEQEEVEITGERKEKRGDITVMTVIRGGQFDGTKVDYRLRRRDGAWRVIDVIIEGVSLVGNYRSQLQDVVSKKGPDGVIELLREKNAAPLEEDEAAGDAAA